jgi:hypothetical protein
MVLRAYSCVSHGQNSWAGNPIYRCRRSDDLQTEKRLDDGSAVGLFFIRSQREGWTHEESLFTDLSSPSDYFCTIFRLARCTRTVRLQACLIARAYYNLRQVGCGSDWAQAIQKHCSFLLGKAEAFRLGLAVRSGFLRIKGFLRFCFRLLRKTIWHRSFPSSSRKFWLMPRWNTFKSLNIQATNLLKSHIFVEMDIDT